MRPTLAFSFQTGEWNSALTLLPLRDVNLARAEDEVGQEIILRVPVAEQNATELVFRARNSIAHVPKPLPSRRAALTTANHAISPGMERYP